MKHYDSTAYMQPSRLLLVDDHVLFRESLGRLLESEPDLTIAAQCGKGSEAIERLREGGIDMMLLDYNLPDGVGTRFVAEAWEAGYGGKILIVTAAIDGDSSAEALQLGVCGVVLKHNPAGALLRALRVTLAGDIWLDPKVVEYLATRAPRTAARGFMETLSARERALVEGLLEGQTNKRIAERLEVTEGAVKATLQALFEKTNVRTRAQLVRVALEGGASGQ